MKGIGGGVAILAVALFPFSPGGVSIAGDVAGDDRRSHPSLLPPLDLRLEAGVDGIPTPLPSRLLKSVSGGQNAPPHFFQPRRAAIAGREEATRREVGAEVCKGPPLGACKMLCGCRRLNREGTDHVHISLEASLRGVA